MFLVGDWAPGAKQLSTPSVFDGLAVINLEGPVLPASHGLAPSSKAGPVLCSATLPKSECGVVFTLANNHMMDFGLLGLEATVLTIKAMRYRSVGAGKDLSKARSAIVVKDRGLRIGIIACCEAQFGVARRTQGGTAEFGPWVYDRIRELRKTVDAVIVSVHAAVEDSPWPSPYIRDLYRSFINAGASVVHGHHAHVPQGYEAYSDGMIFYGMGNFAVDPDKWRNYPNGMWSLAAEIDFDVKPVRWRQLTIEIRHQPGSDAIAIEESNDEERAGHNRYLEICNRPFDDPELFDALWQEVALRAYYHHGAEYMRFSGPPPSGRRVQARAGLSMLKGALLNRSTPSFRLRQNDYLLWYHMIACESHRQMLATALGVLAGEIEDLRTAETHCLADEMMPWSVGVSPE